MQSGSRFANQMILEMLVWLFRAFYFVSLMVRTIQVRNSIILSQ